MAIHQPIFAQPKSVRLINEAICLSPSHWTADHVEALPKDYVLEHISAYNLGKIWQQLSERLKTDPDFQQHLPCNEHYNLPEDQYHIDGPPPPKSRCWRCLDLKMMQSNTK